MRETRDAQASIFDFYSKHESAQRFRQLSDLLDEHPILLSLIEQDFDRKNLRRTGARGLSLESILRCLLLKQILQISYQTLAFVLSDSPTYRAFARLPQQRAPGKSALQATIRQISAETLQQINHHLLLHWVNEKKVSVSSLRIDSTVVLSNIPTPCDSQLLVDGIRVLTRLMTSSRRSTGVKLRITDQRKRSKSLGFRIFNAKKAEKEVLYPKLLSCASTVLKQIERAILKVEHHTVETDKAAAWIDTVEHYRLLLQNIVHQTQRRVLHKENVPASDKIVSVFEPHTDVIVKAQRDVLYGHKVNLATQANGFVTYANIESGNPADRVLYLPVLDACVRDYGEMPNETAADGGYASQQNVATGREKGVDRTVFNKRCGLSFHQMGVKKKTFERLRDFRAGVEGNISELKRAFGMGKATWKKREGFAAYVWSCVLSYNLVRMIRFSSA